MTTKEKPLKTYILDDNVNISNCIIQVHICKCVLKHMHKLKHCIICNDVYSYRTITKK